MNNTTKVVIRTGASIAAIGTYSFADKVFTNEASLFSAQQGATQLQDVDQPFNQAVMQTASGAHLSSVILLAALGAVWFKPIKNKLSSLANKNTLPALLIASASAATALTATTPAHAYFDRKDNPEFVEVMPNSTAFFIPEMGANRAGQARFMSEQYLNDNYDPTDPTHDHGKVAMKRIQIPHVQIVNPGLFDSNMYVPSAKVIMVDRTPYMREWNDDADRGTSAKKEGFRMETKDSVNISLGIVIEAAVKEEDAAKFLYNFGASTAGRTKTNDPATTYASVIDGRSLSDVMDSNGRGIVQAVLADEFAGRTFDTALAEKKAIMQAVRTQVTKDFADVGITLVKIGFDTPLNFADNIQNAIDATVINTKLAAAADTIRPALPILQQQAQVHAMEGFATAVQKWNGQLPNLPSVMVMSPEVTDLISSILGSPSRSAISGNGTAVAAPAAR